MMFALATRKKRGQSNQRSTNSNKDLHSFPLRCIHGRGVKSIAILLFASILVVQRQLKVVLSQLWVDTGTVTTASDGVDVYDAFSSPFSSSSASLSSRALTDQQQTTNSPSNTIKEQSQQLPHHHRLLRIDWKNLTRLSDGAKELYESQHDCSKPVRYYPFRSWKNISSYGLGSDLHTYGNAIYMGYSHPHQRFRARAVHSSTINASLSLPWDWLDQEACKEETHHNILTCYFPNIENTHCHSSEENTFIFEEPVVDKVVNQPLHRVIHNMYRRKVTDYMEKRRTITEFMFSSVSDIVVQEAERQLRLVFPDDDGGDGHRVPSNLVTVHIRWGDKNAEMALVQVDKYIQAIRNVTIDLPKEEELHILLCTEDPEAVLAFQNAMPPRWKLHLDHFYTEYEPYRSVNGTMYNVAPRISQQLRGKPGLWALASALVAMEANYYVLTTRSNWSRLLDELRTSIIDPRCNDCTRMIDLRRGFG